MKKLTYYFILVLFIISTSAFSQEHVTYQKPSQPILELFDYDNPPYVSTDKDMENMLFIYRNPYKTLEELSQDEVRLAGLRINPNLFASSRITYYKDLKLRKVKNVKDEPKTIDGMPENARIYYPTWSPDYSSIAFTNATNEGLELWVIDVNKTRAKRLLPAILNATSGKPFIWQKDSKGLFVTIRPDLNTQLIDHTKTLPEGPIVQTAEGQVSQNRTYQDLLQNKIDEQNFESLIISEIQTVNLKGKLTPYLPKDMYTNLSLSPNGDYLLVSKIEKPFSYIVPMSRFPMSESVYDMNGKPVKKVNELPLREIMPKGFMSTYQGKRNMDWRKDEPATLYYVVALDEGDAANEVEFRDEIFVWKAPFDQSPESLYKTKLRFNQIIWGDTSNAIVYDYWYDNRSLNTTLINPKTKTSQLINSRNFQDRYADPGNFETERNEFDEDVIAVKSNKMYLIGDGYTPEGQFPFIDELDINTLETKRLYQSNYTDKKENIYAIKDFDKGKALVRIESKNDYPNYYLRYFKTESKPEQFTFFKNPFESIKDVHKEVIKYKRADGVDLTGTLYLPVGYDRKKKEKLPLLIWAYPVEYKDKNSAGQNTQNANEFTYPYYGSFVYWVTKGYAVLDDAAFPIIGEGDQEPNDTFIEQLVANGRAAIDAVDALGYIDRTKVAVGGHSYGAFMTANLLTHSDDFACGIARSGAYNRTLTPFGFQSEQRNYWDNPDIYNTMSPFMNAEKMKKPILLIHGEADNNPGTFTLQTERYFQAIKGLGGNARMVILPKESHGYQAKKNLMHMLWEQEQFLDKYLK